MASSGVGVGWGEVERGRLGLGVWEKVVLGVREVKLRLGGVGRVGRGRLMVKVAYWCSVRVGRGWLGLFRAVRVGGWRQVGRAVVGLL